MLKKSSGISKQEIRSSKLSETKFLSLAEKFGFDVYESEFSYKLNLSNSCKPVTIYADKENKSVMRFEIFFQTYENEKYTSIREYIHAKRIEYYMDMFQEWYGRKNNKAV